LLEALLAADAHPSTDNQEKVTESKKEKIVALA
jgi:hypothetical protein